MNINSVNYFKTLPRGTYDYHVVPRDGMWAIKNEQFDDYSFEGEYQDVMTLGMQMAQEGACNLVIHSNTGKFNKTIKF